MLDIIVDTNGAYEITALSKLFSHYDRPYVFCKDCILHRTFS